MRSIFNFIIAPKEDRYNNKKSIGNKELILNTEISDYRYISRNGVVLETPVEVKTDIKTPDKAIFSRFPLQKVRFSKYSRAIEVLKLV